MIKDKMLALEKNEPNAIKFDSCMTGVSHTEKLVAKAFQHVNDNSVEGCYIKHFKAQKEGWRREFHETQDIRGEKLSDTSSSSDGIHPENHY